MNTKFLAAVGALWLLLPVGEAGAQDQDIEERQITLVGCVMREYEYRDTYGPGLSGPRGPGIGGRDEYMLVDAREVDAGTADVTAATCPPTLGTFPTAYELTGSREGELEAFVGRRVELTGMQKGANARFVGTSGTLRPTGGFDPLGHELHLVEVEVASFRQPAPPRAEAPPPAAPPARVEAPAPVPEPPAPAPAREVAVAEPAPAPAQEQRIEEPPQQVARLPRTASPLPLAGLIGLLSLAAAAGLRAYRSRA